MQIGAGVAGGDMSGGLQRAGEAVTDINALAKTEARAERRMLQEYGDRAEDKIEELELGSEELAYQAGLAEHEAEQEFKRWQTTTNMARAAQSADNFFKKHQLEAADRAALMAAYKTDAELYKDMKDLNFDRIQDASIAKRAALVFLDSQLENVMDNIPLGVKNDPDKLRDWLKLYEEKLVMALIGELGADFADEFLKDVELGGPSRRAIGTQTQEWGELTVN